MNTTGRSLNYPDIHYSVISLPIHPDMAALFTFQRSHVSVYLLCFLSLIFGTTSGELRILLDLKTALQKSNTHAFDSWQFNQSPCNFTGITCNSNGFITEIELSNRNLTGNLPLDSICQLRFLEKLSFGFNFLFGPITDDLKNCSKLRYLDLGNNNLFGSIPNLSSLSELEYLYLNTSRFSGIFPWDSLERMTGLISLSLGDNRFDSSPFPNQIVKLYNLRWVFLTNCGISGEIPAEIGNLTELVNLELADNTISGEIPVEISKLKKLWQLELYNNSLTGKIPAGFGNLTSLENFDASMNFLEGDLSELRFLKNLVSLQLFENSLSGEVPAEFGEFKKLKSLSLYKNKLRGSLPSKIGSWADFVFIDVSENQFSGEIPPEMCKKGTMTGLLMLQNKLSGTIPANYASCFSLRRFRVSNNSLNGVIPAGIWGLPNVNIIDVELNQFEGPITSEIGKAKSLGQLFLSENKFSGELPEEISKALSLDAIDLSFNQFSGSIPVGIGKLRKLSSLQLQNNIFSGNIPVTLGSCNSLSDLNLAHNFLSGEIPSSLGSLPTLNSLNLAGNKLSGQIPASLSSLRLSLLDLSNNQLTGKIPQSLSIEAYNGSFAGNPNLCSSTVSFFRRCSSNSGMSKDVRTLIICLLIGTVMVLLYSAFYFYIRKSEKDHDRSLKQESWDVKSFHILNFSENEILDSIKEENQIGKGGSGNVYIVSLSNGLELAVKHIWSTNSGGRKKSKFAGKSKQFDAEVETLSSIRHVNVVKLYCSITGEDSSLLVYEYLPNGSLWDRLHSCQKMELDWETRYEIAVGAAKGLEYLHHGCDRPVIHRDVKSSNILLDEFLKPRIADFGLAKIVMENGGSKDSTHVIAGTHGYIAPEYGYTCKVNEKSDVYSFGVVLMELVTGKRPIEPEYGENKDIVNWVCKKLKTRESVLSIVDSKIPQALKDEAIKVLRIAILCTATLPNLRPTMRSVVHMLEEAEPCKLVTIFISKDGESMKMEGLESDKLISDTQV